MREWLVSAIKIILIIVIAVVIINDVGTIILSNWQSCAVADEIAMATVRSYKLTRSVEQAQEVAKDWAGQRMVKLTNLTIEEDAVTLTIEIPKKRTYIIRHIKFLENILPSSKTVSREISPK